MSLRVLILTITSISWSFRHAGIEGISRSMFFVGIISLVIFTMFGGKVHHVLSGKWIDEDLRKPNDDLPKKSKQH